jgi:hypothetical protein
VTLLLAFLEHATGRRRRLRAKFVPRSQLEPPQKPEDTHPAPVPAARQAARANGRQASLKTALPAADGPDQAPPRPDQLAAATAHDPFAAPDLQRQPFFGLAGAVPGAAPTPQPSLAEPGAPPPRPPAAVGLRPAAPPERQHVLGSRAPVRGAFAGQLLAEPLLQSLLGRLGPDARAPSAAVGGRLPSVV